MPGLLKKVKVVAFCLSLTTCFAGTVNAATTKSGNLEAERQQLFNQMLQQPDNLQIALSYAALSARVGDFEGAVSTLERMLIYAPGMPRLQMELGVLYYRLGNFDTSQSYFKAALSGRDIPEDVRLRVEEYLKLVEKKLKRFRWSAKTYLGLRWQSNANAGPSADVVTLNGIPVTLKSSSVKKSDFGFVMQDQAHLEYDFLSQGDKLELDYVDYGTLQFDQSRLNSAISEVTVGPAFNLGRFELDETFASIYGIANGALLYKSIYFGTLGVGSRVVSKPNRETVLVLKGEFRHQWFNNTSRRMTADDRNGNEYRLVGDAKYMFTRDLRGVLTSVLSRKDRRAKFYDYWEFGQQVRFDKMFDPLIGSMDLPWTVTASAGYLRRKYDTPDPLVMAGKRQKDTEFWLRGNLHVPITRSWAFMPKVEYREVDSNNPLRDYKAFTATIGVEYSQ